MLRRLWANIQKQFKNTRFNCFFSAAPSARTTPTHRPLARAVVWFVESKLLNITLYVIPLRPVHTAQRANSLAVTIFAEALTASPNALRRSSNERLRWFTIFDARRVRVAYFGQNSGPKYCTKWFLNWLFWFLRRLSSKVCRYYGSLYNIRYKTNRFGATALGIS